MKTVRAIRGNKQSAEVRETCHAVLSCYCSGILYKKVTIAQIQMHTYGVTTTQKDLAAREK